MAESVSQKIGNKSGHIFNQGMMWLKKGAQIGAVIGAVAAVGSLFLAANVASMGLINVAIAAAGYGLVGAAGGAVAGLCSGGIFGTLKGMLTRPKPNGEQIMQDALNCEKPHVDVLTPAQEPQVAQQPEQAQAPQQPTANASALPQEALAELNAMTKTLNEIQANAQVASQSQQTEQLQPAAQASAAVPANWQQRVQPQPEATVRER